MTAGYSGTPLAKRLSLRDGQRVWFDGMPEDIIDEIDEYALELDFVEGPENAPDAAHIFVTERAALTDKLKVLRNSIAQDGHIWVSWPKQDSGVATEVGEEDVRGAGLALGLIDTKKCAVNEVWSGLKFAICKELRT